MAGIRPVGVTVIAVLTVISGLIALLAGFAMFGLGLLGTEISPLVAVAGTFGGVLLIGIGGLSFYTAWGAWKLRSWAWTVLAILSIIGIVLAALTRSSWFSLILNVIILIYLFRPGVKAAFGRPTLSSRMKMVLAISVLAVVLAAWAGIRMVSDAQPTAEAQAQVASSRGNLKNIATAVESYLLDRGSYPGTLVDLVPNYLREVPSDPCTNRAYAYTPSGAPPTDYLLSITFPPGNQCNAIVPGLSYTPAGGLREAP